MSLEFTGHICPLCGGSGKSEREEDEFICPECDGEGYTEAVRIKSSKKSEE